MSFKLGGLLQGLGQGMAAQDKFNQEIEQKRQAALERARQFNSQVAHQDRMYNESVRKINLDEAYRNKKLAVDSQPKTDGGFTLSPDEVRFDEEGKAIARGLPKKNKDSLVTVNNKQESASAKVVGKYDGEAYTGAMQDAKNAYSSNNTLRRTEQMMQRVATGKLAPTINSVKSLAKTLGVDLESLGITDDVGPAEALNSLTLDYAMSTVQDTKGAISNAEMKLFIEAAPGLARTPEGNQLMIDFLKRSNELKINLAETLRNHRKEKGGIGADIHEVIAQFHEANPLFTDDLQARLNNGGLPQSRSQAPQAAIDYLKQNPQLKSQFQSKYGYLPEGI